MRWASPGKTNFKRGTPFLESKKKGIQIFENLIKDVINIVSEIINKASHFSVCVK